MLTSAFVLALAFILPLWTLFALAARALMANSRRDPVYGLAELANRAYCRLVHRLRIDGRDHLPAAGPLLIVANHSAGVDPCLIQAAVPFHVRWMMARDMMAPALADVWEWLRVIPVSRDRADSQAARAALRALESGDVVGIFPEGAIERPGRTLLPFLPGVGLIIKRSGAPVLPVLIDGTPDVEPAWASLWNPSRARVRFAQPISYARSALSAEQIAEDLHRRFADWAQWPQRADRPKPGPRPRFPY